MFVEIITMTKLLKNILPSLTLFFLPCLTVAACNWSDSKYVWLSVRSSVLLLLISETWLWAMSFMFSLKHSLLLVLTQICKWWKRHISENTSTRCTETLLNSSTAKSTMCGETLDVLFKCQNTRGLWFNKRKYWNLLTCWNKKIISGGQCTAEKCHNSRRKMYLHLQIRSVLQRLCRGWQPVIAVSLVETSLN